MKSTLITASLLGLVAAAAIPLHAQAVQPLLSGTVGSGSDESYVVIDFENGTSTTPDNSYAFGYLYNSGDDPTGYTMIQAIAGDLSGVTGVPGFAYTSTYYDESFGSGYVIDSFTYDGLTETEPADYSSYWDYYISTDSQFSEPDSGEGVSDRTLSDGSYDGWAFDVNGATPLPVTPLASAAPEPSQMGMLGLIGLGLGGLLLAARRRRRA